jgi:hypothetical protein
VREKPTPARERSGEKQIRFFFWGFVLIRERFLARAGGEIILFFPSTGAAVFDAFLGRFLLLPLVVVPPRPTL